MSWIFCKSTQRFTSTCTYNYKLVWKGLVLLSLKVTTNRRFVHTAERVRTPRIVSRFAKMWRPRRLLQRDKLRVCDPSDKVQCIRNNRTYNLHSIKPDRGWLGARLHLSLPIIVYTSIFVQIGSWSRQEFRGRKKPKDCVYSVQIYTVHACAYDVYK